MASSLLTLSALAALSALPSVAAQSVCRDRYVRSHPPLALSPFDPSSTVLIADPCPSASAIQGRSYYCNGGLGYGSRWGIGVGIGAFLVSSPSRKVEN